MVRFSGMGNSIRIAGSCSIQMSTGLKRHDVPEFYQRASAFIRNSRPSLADVVKMKELTM